jgi:hypothetical protein
MDLNETAKVNGLGAFYFFLLPFVFFEMKPWGINPPVVLNYKRERTANLHEKERKRRRPNQQLGTTN